MSIPPLDRPVTDRPSKGPLDHAAARPLPAALRRARADVVAAARDLLAIPEHSLVKPWPWRGGSFEEVRYGAYRAGEALDLAAVEARTRMAADEATETQAARLIGPATTARWELQGVLMPLDDALIDADPGSDQWSIRQVLGHTIASLRGYGWGAPWWEAEGFRGDGSGLSEDVPYEDGPDAQGTLTELRDRLDSVLDMSAERLGGLPDEQTASSARWGGAAVWIGFGFGRWSSHLREHTVQIEKTFAMLGHRPAEPARLVRHLLAAYGRAEATVFGRLGTDDAAERIATGARESRDAISSAKASAKT